MYPSQARGYILEYAVLQQMKAAGYIDVKSGFVRGRGANHQIDAYGKLSIPTAFIYPIRLLSEAKFHKKTIQLGIIRNFVGVIKDISENYFVTSSHRRNSFRYTDAGCIFSATPFDESAQEYAWAHNIFLMSFADIEAMKPIIDTINLCVQYPGIVAILNDDEENKQRRILRVYKKIWKSVKPAAYPTLVIGILDNIYPVVLVGKNNWISHLEVPPKTDKLEIEKDYRQDFPDNQLIVDNRTPNRNQTLYHIFHLKFKFGTRYEPIEFNIPNFAAKKIIRRIKNSERKIAELQIPLIDKSEGKSIRRIIKLEVKMPT